MSFSKNQNNGFTLIEMSIVIVIIGLIVGGILVGRDMIRAAEIRAQISQIEKYNAAVNAFHEKYNAIPGDMPNSQAVAYGFFPRGIYPSIYGDGDGDGYVEAMPPDDMTPTFYVGSYFFLGGENVLFWTDLSAAELVDGSFNDNSNNPVNATNYSQYAAEMPPAKIGNGNFIYVNASYIDSNGNFTQANGFQIVNIYSITSADGEVFINAGLTPSDAYNMDQKIDDGAPLTGNVIAMYPDSALGTIGAGSEIQTAMPVPNACVTGAAPSFTYNLTDTSFDCSLRFNTNW